MEFVKLAFYVAMFIISMVQMTRSKKKATETTDTETASSAAKPPESPSHRQATLNKAASSNNHRQKPQSPKRSRRTTKPAGPNSAVGREPRSGQPESAAGQQTTTRFEAATDDPSEQPASRPIPAFAAFTGFPVLVGLVGACGSWLFHGREAIAVGGMAGAGTGFFAAIMYTLYHSTNHPDWEPPTSACGAQHRPVSLFAARAIPTGAAGGMLIGWMIPARGNWEVYFAPFVLMLFGVLAAMFISLLHEAAARRGTAQQA